MMLQNNIDLTQTLKITHHEEIAEGIFEFEFRDPSGAMLPGFTPGAHLCVETPNGSIRRYSLSNDPSEQERYAIAVKREENGSGGSKNLTDDTREGDLIRVSVPRNDFELKDTSAHYIFIAGGIGITPILSMIRYLKSHTSKAFKLYYLTREPTQSAYLDLLSSPEFRGRVVIHHTNGDSANVFDLWPVLEQHKGAHLYCCGPRRLMETVRDMTGHWPKSQVTFEDFGSVKPAAKTEDVAFSVRLHGSEDSIPVPVGVSILEALSDNGYRVPYSCESGTCGSCRCKLLAGDADHRDLVLSETEQNKHIMVCVSRARSAELVLDIDV